MNTACVNDAITGTLSLPTLNARGRPEYGTARTIWGATILMPSSMVDSLNPGNGAFAFALAGQAVVKPEIIQPEPPQRQQQAAA